MFHFNWIAKAGKLISTVRNLIIVSLTNRFRGNKNPNKKLNFSTLLHVAFITLKSNPSCGMEARLQLRYTPSILHYLSLSSSDKPSLCRLTVFKTIFVKCLSVAYILDTNLFSNEHGKLFEWFGRSILYLMV